MDTRVQASQSSESVQLQDVHIATVGLAEVRSRMSTALSQLVKCTPTILRHCHIQLAAGMLYQRTSGQGESEGSRNSSSGSGSRSGVWRVERSFST